MQGYLFKLEAYKGPPSRHVCPGCGKRNEFARYVNIETREYAHETVGRCNRESSCGYHLTPKQYFSDNGVLMPKYREIEPVKQPESVPVDYVPFDLVDKSMAGYDKTNFALFIQGLFGERAANESLQKYYVGRSRLDNGKATIFWRVDAEGKARTGKIMRYNPETGKKVKEIPPTWVHRKLLPFNYHLCFFGEHLLSEHPAAPVAIVESEKTALIASIFMPGIVWIATGGNSGCKWREYAVYKALAGRNVTLYPDYGYFNKQAQKTCYQEWKDRAEHIQERMKCSIKVSRALEDKLTESDRANDLDLADILVRQDTQTGHALTDKNYPVIWDLGNVDNC